MQQVILRALRNPDNPFLRKDPSDSQLHGRESSGQSCPDEERIPSRQGRPRWRGRRKLQVVFVVARLERCPRGYVHCVLEIATALGVVPLS